MNPRQVSTEMATADLSSDIPLQTERKSAHQRLCWLLVVAAALHVPSLFGPFFVDDYVYIGAVQSLDWSGVVDIFTSSTLDESASSVWWVPEGTLPFYRPIGELTFALDHLIWGTLPVGYHLTNLLLHLFCTYLVWRLARYLFDAEYAPVAVACVFAIHPVHTEAVAWISGRFDLLVCAASLGSVLSYLRWRMGKPSRKRWLAAALLLFMIGLGCKETALALPAVVAGLEIIMLRGRLGKTRILHLIMAAIGFGVIAIVYLKGRFALFGGLGELPPPYGIDRSNPLVALGNVAWNSVLYFLDFVLGVPVDAFYLSEFWWRHPRILALAITIGLLLLLVAFVRAWSQRSFRTGLVWLALFTAPALLAMPGERNVYLATVGLAIMFGAVFAGFVNHSQAAQQPNRWTYRIAIAIVGIWSLVCVVQQGFMWGLAAAGEKIYCDIEKNLPDPPPGSRIYVVNQSPINSIGFVQALRLRYGRNDLTGAVLTVAPTLDPTCRDLVERTSADTVRIVRERGTFFDSFIERFHLFGAPHTSLLGSARRLGLELMNPPESFDNLHTIELRLPLPIDDPRVHIFVWDNTSIRSLYDFANMIRVAGLVRWPTPNTDQP